MKLDKIIEDRSKFPEAKLQDDAIHPIIQKENSIAYYVKSYLKKVDGYAAIISSGSKRGKRYGLAKAHKDNTPLRLVVSMIGTPEYKLAKYMDNLIKPHIPRTYLLKSTADFIKRLKQFPCNNSYRIVSFDVVSLFTNVPLSETIELIINRLCADGNPYVIPFDKDVFRKLMFMVTQGLLMQKDKIYKQIDCVTMGSCLGPTLANFFVGCLEEKLFANTYNLLPNLYLRYRDDIYAVFDSDSACTQFLDILNSQHKDIKFTSEKTQIARIYLSYMCK